MSSYAINVLILLLIIIKNGFELGQFMEQTHPRAVRIMNQLPHLHLKIAHAAVLTYMHLFICFIFSGTYISINLLIYLFITIPCLCFLFIFQIKAKYFEAKNKTF